MIRPSPLFPDPGALETLTLRVRGLDCAGCARRVQHAVSAVPGVQAVDVLLATGSAVVTLDPARATRTNLRDAIVGVGFSVADHLPAGGGETVPGDAPQQAEASSRAIGLFAVAFAAVVIAAVVGEWTGLTDAAARVVPPLIWMLAITTLGLPVLGPVVRSAARGQVTAHTLVALGGLAAALIGEWVTAAIVVALMRVAAGIDRYAVARGRQALGDLLALAPQQAWLDMGDELPRRVLAREVRVGQRVLVRPGERVPVDGEVLWGEAAVDRSPITGEATLLDVGPGAHVFASSTVHGGSLRMRATQVAADSTFGRIVRHVEQAEGHRADIHHLADRVSGYYLPVVLAVALLTLAVGRGPLAAASVLVVACSCAFALATPLAMLASVAASARHGLLVKGGKYLEALARADVLLIDKTGTLTLGRPTVTRVLPCGGVTEDALVALAAGAERDSEHPLAEAVRREASRRGVTVPVPTRFESIAGRGVRAVINGASVVVGTERLVAVGGLPDMAAAARAAGDSVMFVERDGIVLGAIAAGDTLRPDVTAALAAVRALGITRLELLTGDHAEAATRVAAPLGLAFRAGLLPEDKIAVVREYQARGHTVVMLGDGVNDAPALVGADVGIAFAHPGADVALEAAHIALLRDDWLLVPRAVAIARRTMRVVQLNLAFTIVYNVVGLGLAASGLLSPIGAAVGHALPDLLILANSSRLLRHR